MLRDFLPEILFLERCLYSCIRLSKVFFRLQNGFVCFFVLSRLLKLRDFYPYPQRTHILRLLGPKTLLYKSFGLC